MKIQIALVDDHVLILDGLAKMLEQYPDILICGTYTTGESFLADVEQGNFPDILLLDIQLSDMSGNELARKVHKRYPELKMIALTSMDTLFHIKDMMQHGCLGYVTKQAPRAILPEAIRRVYAGEEYLEPGIKERWMESLSQSNRKRSQLNPLSSREQEILELIAREYTTQEIADELFLSLKTVESHRYSLLQKLDVKNTAGLIRKAIQLGLLE